MGIRNQKVTVHLAWVGGLITPHGDSELRMYALLVPGMSPHNPSWGFGTMP